MGCVEFVFCQSCIKQWFPSRGLNVINERRVADRPVIMTTRRRDDEMFDDDKTKTKTSSLIRKLSLY